MSCLKKGTTSGCSFHFPIPPKNRTSILKPFEGNEETFEQKLEYLKLGKEIEKFLNNLKLGSDLTFEAFLAILNTDEETYIKVIRRSLKTEKIKTISHRNKSKQLQYYIAETNEIKSRSSIRARSICLRSIHHRNSKTVKAKGA